MKIDKLDELNELFRLILSRANSMNGAAKLSKVAQSTLSDWGTGKTVPGLKNYIQLCRSLGCRPGKELDNFLGLAENPPQTAEDLLGVALSLSEAEQQKLIYLIAFRFSNILRIEEMIHVQALQALILQHLKENRQQPKEFIKIVGITQAQYSGIMRGRLVGSVEDVEAQLSLLASILRNPNTGRAFRDRESLIEYCEPKSPHTEEFSPNGTNQHQTSQAANLLGIEPFHQ